MDYEKYFPNMELRNAYLVWCNLVQAEPGDVSQAKPGDLFDERWVRLWSALAERGVATAQATLHPSDPLHNQQLTSRLCDILISASYAAIQYGENGVDGPLDPDHNEGRMDGPFACMVETICRLGTRPSIAPREATTAQYGIWLGKRIETVQESPHDVFEYFMGDWEREQYPGVDKSVGKALMQATKDVDGFDHAFLTKMRTFTQYKIFETPYGTVVLDLHPTRRHRGDQ